MKKPTKRSRNAKIKKAKGQTHYAGRGVPRKVRPGMANVRGDVRYVRIGKEMIRLMKDDAVRNPRCIDCGEDTDATNEQYMIHDELWRKANPAEAGMLCVGCCERRLGRELQRKDFRPYCISGFDEGLPRFRSASGPPEGHLARGSSSNKRRTMQKGWIFL